LIKIRTIHAIEKKPYKTIACSVEAEIVRGSVQIFGRVLPLFQIRTNTPTQQKISKNSAKT